MGPLPFSSGNDARHAGSMVAVAVASMGPLPFSSGNEAMQAVSARWVFASMGPLPFSSGNEYEVDVPGQLNKRFNGAAAFQQRKSERGPGVREGGQAASMGPLPFSSGNIIRTRSIVSGDNWLQWGRCLSAAEIRYIIIMVGYARKRINGAAAFQQRKSFGSCDWLWPGKEASMGPLPFSSGNLESTLSSCCSYLRFNGAAAFQQRKSRTAARRVWIFMWLQWGRCLSAAEMFTANRK